MVCGRRMTSVLGCGEIEVAGAGRPWVGAARVCRARGQLV